MLNISSSSIDVEFRYEKKNNLSELEDFSFSNAYIDSLNNFTLISIFFSGENVCQSSFKFEIHDDTRGNSWDVGPIGLVHGWNKVEVYRDNWID